MIRAPISPTTPDPEVLERAAGVILSGGVVAVPTDTLYGLAVDPFNADAVARLFALKGRPQERALPLMAADVALVERALGRLPDLAGRLAATFWPGPLTLLVPAAEGLTDGVTGGSRRVGVRVPAHRVARELSRACDRLLTATSANRSGEPANSDPNQVAEAIGPIIDLLLDAGVTPGGLPSTIVDVMGNDLRLVRAGAIPWEDIQACLSRV